MSNMIYRPSSLIKTEKGVLEYYANAAGAYDVCENHRHTIWIKSENKCSEGLQQNTACKR